MKNLITCMACVMLLMAFLVQFIHQEYGFIRLIVVNHAIESFEKLVKEEGAISTRNKSWLCKKISTTVECDEQEVEINLIESEQSGKKVVTYEIGFPVKDTVANPRFWGI